MSLPENLILGGAYPTGTAVASLALNKSQYGKYIASNIDLDNPLVLSFDFKTKNNGNTTWQSRITQHRTHLNQMGNMPDYNRSDAEFAVWFGASAPIGTVVSGLFTQAEVALRLRQMCIMALTGDTIDRMVRGEL